MTRPNDLPDFGSPPLSEVVLGVQFERPQGYQQIMAGEVWELFKENFPNVEEHDALAPSFEVFGTSGAISNRLELRHGPQHDRFWFLDQRGSELLQFQGDRFLHNWRKMDPGADGYPRYEHILDNFLKNLANLSGYFQKRLGAPLKYNQAEISYVNTIDLTEEDDQRNPDYWIDFIEAQAFGAEDLSVSIRKTLKSNDEPFGRLTVNANTGLKPPHGRVLSLSLIVKGQPFAPDENGLRKFLDIGRREIVENFAIITTPEAHKYWNRSK